MKWFVCCVLTFALSTCSTRCEAADDSVKPDDVYRYANLQVSIRSWNPDNPIQTHKRHSSGSCSHGGTVGLGVGGENGVSVEVRCLPGRESIIADIKVEPYESNVTTKPSQNEIELSDLRNKFIEVSKDENGRVYFLVIQPEIVEAKLPAQFDVEVLAPYDWDFPSSPVILNDETFVGRVGMSGGTLVGIEIAGIANLEFSLLPLKDAKPIGTLQGGNLTIKTDDNVIVISGVRNGTAKDVLEGPFKVWVRQLKSSSTKKELQDAFSEQLRTLEKRQAEGDLSITNDVIDRIKSYIKTGRPMLLGSSARDVRKNELGE